MFLITLQVSSHMFTFTPTISCIIANSFIFILSMFGVAYFCISVSLTSTYLPSILSCLFHFLSCSSPVSFPLEFCPHLLIFICSNHTLSIFLFVSYHLPYNSLSYGLLTLLSFASLPALMPLSASLHLSFVISTSGLLHLYQERMVDMPVYSTFIYATSTLYILKSLTLWLHNLYLWPVNCILSLQCLIAGRDLYDTYVEILLIIVGPFYSVRRG
jgi:hypothetical protein